MKLIKLSSGETLELNINFLTLKLVMSSGILDKQKDKSDDTLNQINVAGKLIWAIMYSNGKKITEDDALALVPIGSEDEPTEAIFDLIEEFQSRAEQFKKKVEARSSLNQVAR